MNIQKLNGPKDGFAHLVLLGIAFLGVAVLVGLIVWRHQQPAQDKTTTVKTTAPTSTPQLAANTAEQASPASPAETPAPTPATPAPPTTPPTTTAPASTIKHPTNADCKGAANPFTVYASNPNGTSAYGMPGGTQAGQVHYTVPYKEAITRVYCDSSNGRAMVYRLDDGATGTYSAFYYSDVSLTQP